MATDDQITDTTDGCKGVWSRDTRQYADRLIYTVGRIAVGSVEHPTVSKGMARKSVASLSVPGIKVGSADYASDEEAKARVEKAFRTWLAWLSE